MRTIRPIEARIKEFGDKATQLLLFLSFSFVAVVTLKSDPNLAKAQQHALTVAMRFWVVALVPILGGVVPLKEFKWLNPRWYEVVRCLKFVLLWAAIILILFGAGYFGCGIWRM